MLSGAGTSSEGTPQASGLSAVLATSLPSVVNHNLVHWRSLCVA